MNNTLINSYFDAFTKKDIKLIEDILSDDITLKDWNVTAFNKKNVLEVFKNIFESFKIIKVDIVDTISQDNKVAVHICISLDETLVQVVDVLYFKDEKIYKINAFKQ